LNLCCLMSTGKYFLHIQSIQQYLEISQHREKIGQHRQRLTLGFHWNIMDRWVETKNQTFKFTIQCFNYERKWWRLFRKGVVYKLDIYFISYVMLVQCMIYTTTYQNYLLLTSFTKVTRIFEKIRQLNFM
jgi:hypothetical protein